MTVSSDWRPVRNGRKQYDLLWRPRTPHIHAETEAWKESAESGQSSGPTVSRFEEPAWLSQEFTFSLGAGLGSSGAKLGVKK